MHLLPRTTALQLQSPSPNNFNKNLTLLQIFSKGSGHRCRTAILLNTSESTCGQNHQNTCERVHC